MALSERRIKFSIKFAMLLVQMHFNLFKCATKSDQHVNQSAHILRLVNHFCPIYVALQLRGKFAHRFAYVG